MYMYSKYTYIKHFTISRIRNPKGIEELIGYKL